MTQQPLFFLVTTIPSAQRINTDYIAKLNFIFHNSLHTYNFIYNLKLKEHRLIHNIFIQHSYYFVFGQGRIPFHALIFIHHYIQFLIGQIHPRKVFKH